MTRHSTLTAALFGAVALTAALPALAEGKSVCFPSYQIDHTSIPNDQTILFHMRGHKIYKANVINKCVGLSINTAGLDEAACHDYLHQTQDRLGLPCVDPVRTGVGAIVDKLLG